MLFELLLKFSNVLNIELLCFGSQISSSSLPISLLSEQFRAMLEKNILESVGYSVVIARDGREALDKALQETFDIVITDILMPRMDGFEFVQALRREKMYKDIPIIIVTTRENDADKRRGLEAGADAYILKKEFTSEGLLDTLERLLG